MPIQAQVGPWRVLRQFPKLDNDKLKALVGKIILVGVTPVGWADQINPDDAVEVLDSSTQVIVVAGTVCTVKKTHVDDITDEEFERTLNYLTSSLTSRKASCEWFTEHYGPFMEPPLLCVLEILVYGVYTDIQN